MRDRIVKGVLVLAACWPAVAVTQQPAAGFGPHREGSFELSLGGGGVYLDHQLGLLIQRGLRLAGGDTTVGRIAVGGVAELAYHLGSSWSLSAGTGVAFGSSATILQPYGSISWTPNINGRTSPFLTLGGGVTNITWKGYRVTSKYGGLVGLGLRHSLGDRLALRIEAREQVESFSDSAAPKIVFNGIGTVGFSWFLGGGPARDTDGDGVPDKADRCPNTPRGAIVDLRGCPIDSDHDGVPDGIDKCPNTPAGVRVDALGCPVDADGDGVPDYLDRCANTPSGVRVDPNGCPLDSDGDGVADYLDRCPSTPANARPVDANGCPVDSDNDGVADYLDRCPNTPANARPVDATGCPVDSDRDGVPDYLDRCPGTPAGTAVDASGCAAAAGRPPVRPDTMARVAPPAGALPAVNRAVVLRDVNFRPNSARLLPAAVAELQRLAAAIKALPDARWRVSGYTSSLGNAQANRRLSQQRAEAVRDFLVAQGVSADNLVAVGYGSAHPRASNRTRAGRLLNMRVEIVRLR